MEKTTSNLVPCGSDLASKNPATQVPAQNRSVLQFPVVQFTPNSSSNLIQSDPTTSAQGPAKNNIAMPIPAADLAHFSASKQAQQNSAQQAVEPSILLPFLQCKVQDRKNVKEEKDKEFQELVNLFSKMEVNVLLLTMIKQILK